jgi:hypothetical protein
MKWKNVLMIFILAICVLILLYISYKQFYKKNKEGLDDNSSISFPPFPITQTQTIKSLAQLDPSYDMRGLNDQYKTVCDGINSSISKYITAFDKYNSNKETDLISDFTSTFVKSFNNVSIYGLGLYAGTIFPWIWRDMTDKTQAYGAAVGNVATTSFRDQFGGFDITNGKIIPGKDGTLDFVEKSTTFKLTDFSPFARLNYYYLKLYIIIEWYMFYLQTPTFDAASVTAVQTTTVQAALARRSQDIKDAKQIADAQFYKWRKAYNASCGDRGRCPGRFDYEIEQKKKLDKYNAYTNSLINGDPSSTNQYNRLSLDALQKAANDEKTNAKTLQTAAQTTAIADYKKFRDNAVNALPKLIPNILNDISGSIINIKNIALAISKLTDSYIASYEAKESRLIYIKSLNSLNNMNDAQISQFITNIVPRFSKFTNSFDITQIDDYNGSITDSGNIEKFHLLSKFNDEFNKLIDANSAAGSTGVSSLINAMQRSMITNKAYFTDPTVIKTPEFRKLNKYSYTFENCNAINYIADVYYRIINAFIPLVYNYVIKNYYKPPIDHPESPPDLCDLTNNSSYFTSGGSNSPASLNKCNGISYNDVYNMMKCLEYHVFNHNNNVSLISYSEYYIDRLLNVRNFMFMLFIKCEAMLEYVITNSIYSQVNSADIPLDGSLYTIGEYINKGYNTIYFDYQNQMDIARFIYLLSYIGLNKIKEDLNSQFSNSKLSQSQNVLLNSKQYIAFIESSKKYTDNINFLYQKIYTNLNNPVTPVQWPSSIGSIGAFISNDMSYSMTNFKPELLMNNLDQFNPNNLTKIEYKLYDGNPMGQATNDTFYKYTSNIINDIQDFLNLPTYFANGSIGGCYSDNRDRNLVFTDANSFQMSIVTNSTGSGTSGYGAVVNCINDTVAYNSINNSNYDVITLKPYNNDSSAFYCYASNKTTVLNSSPGSSNFKVPTDISKCLIDDPANIADTTIIYNVDAPKFDPNSTITPKGCYDVSNVAQGVYNTLPHRLGGDLTKDPSPLSLGEKCQKLVQDSNNNKNTTYDIYGITSNPNNTNEVNCFAGNKAFDAAHALDSNLQRDDYSLGCNINHPGVGNYLIFQDAAAVTGCQTTSQDILDQYNKLKTDWLNENIKNQTDNLKTVSGLINDIMKKFPVKFNVSQTFLVKPGNKISQSNPIEIDNTPDSIPNNINLKLYLMQGKQGDPGGNGIQGVVGNNTIGDEGLPGYKGYYG